MTTSSTQELVEQAVREQSQRALASGARLLAVFTAVFAVMSMVLAATGLAPNQLPPSLFAGGGCVVATGVWWAARRRRLYGRVTFVAAMVLALFPTVFFALVQWLTPTGAAPFMLGPPVLVYFVLILFSGFFLVPAHSVAAGIVAGLGYLLIYLWVQPSFSALTLPDAVWRQEFTNPAVFVARAGVMAFFGVGVATLARFARGLVLRVLDEQQEAHEVRSLFGSYVSDVVAAKILRERGALKGERKHVAVLFCDLRGFTTMSEGLDPEQLVARLNAYLDAMVRCITARGGVVDKFIGDAVMGVFGGVSELADPCGAALLAARDMRKALQAFAGTLDNGIGLHWGDVVQGAIGSELRREFTVIGDAVNVAARLEGLTRQHGCGILVSAAFAERLAEPMRQQLRSLGPVQVKGRSAPVEILVGDEPSAMDVRERS
ncbi:MAG: adenylate/guanylate cyclase domain-containing protein [Myxococcota bacterium]